VQKTSSLTADRSHGLVAALLALSWLGLFVHNSIELPALNLLSAENSLPALVAVVLFAGGCYPPGASQQLCFLCGGCCIWWAELLSR
jgi:hypothetical protein